MVSNNSEANGNNKKTCLHTLARFVAIIREYVALVIDTIDNSSPISRLYSLAPYPIGTVSHLVVMLVQG